MAENPPVHFSEPDMTDAEVDAALRVLRSGWLTTGAECQALEEELAAYLDVEHVVGVSSCTAAIEIAYAARRLPAGARVGVPAWTFVSTALAPAHRGARIVLLDVDEDTLNLSPGSLRAALGAPGGLDAVVGVHFAGVPMASEVRELCAEAGVPLIEDCAHALGTVDDRGVVAGQRTAGAAFSFYATKNLTCGEGGALATDDGELAEFARTFRLHGLSKDAWARYTPGTVTGEYDVVDGGLKANLPDLLAAVARAQLARFASMQARRRELVQRYRELLGADGRLAVVPAARPGGSADHLMVVLLPDGVERAALRVALGDAGVASSVHFTPLHRFTWFQRSGHVLGAGGLPTTEAVERRALSLPLHSRMTTADVARVCDVLSDLLS